MKRAHLPGGFIRSVQLLRERVEDFSRYPFSIPAVRALEELALDPKVTFLVGENGSGKSTLIEALALLAGFNAEGGSKSFNFATRRSESELHAAMRLVRGARREKNGFFLRAESFFNVATQVDELGATQFYGGTSLHEQSHGESFLALVKHRFKPESLFFLDEPEAALSPARQLTLLAHMHELVERGRSQFIIATHSPIVLAYPGATIYRLSEDGIAEVAYEETEHFALTRDFLLHRERFFRELFRGGDDQDTS
ncbi:AAA family ATPase [Sorangium cellulosum]|uniref:AAA family ATPase n=1 Tax=Sorangium cellulosum TaxID=56 RepID=A0A150RX54_SORCE|nr:AAA family ATPase [Sorangium cellulosum]KYF96182.1 AAA family ATPase [Sorangium cellulosum]